MPANSPPIRRTLLVSAKLTLAAALLGFLLVQVQRQSGFSRLVHEPKAWRLLAIGLAATLASITLTFVRWHILLASLDIGFRLRDTVRLGALGFALNFVSLGSIGGDLFKAIFAAKDSPGKRTEAVASVVVDRLVGVSMMLLLATIATWLVDWSTAPPAVQLLIESIRLGTVGLITAVALILLFPALSGERLQEWLFKIPLVGGTAARLTGTISSYRRKKTQVLSACGISLASNALFILSFFFIAVGLPVQAPTLVQHFVIVPVANLAGAIPATPSGLGTMELALDKLYQATPREPAIPAGDGTLVALGQRATMILVAAACLALYVLQRGDLRQVMHEVEAMEATEAAQAN